jgi:hypothetical protein
VILQQNTKGRVRMTSTSTPRQVATEGGGVPHDRRRGLRPRRGLASGPGAAPSRAAGGGCRARPHCRFAPPLILCAPDSLTYSVPLFLSRQCDRTLGGRRGRGGGGGRGGAAEVVVARADDDGRGHVPGGGPAGAGGKGLIIQSRIQPLTQLLHLHKNSEALRQRKLTR